MVDLRRKEVNRNLQSVTEETDLFRLRFQVFPLRVGKDKIEHSDASLDVFDFVLPAIANILAVDLAVEPAREQVIDRSALWKAFGPGVFLRVKLVPEAGRARRRAADRGTRCRLARGSTWRELPSLTREHREGKK